MEESELRGLVCDIVNETIRPIIEKSVEECGKIVTLLAETTKANQEMYDKHLTALEYSRDCAQKNSAELIKANMELTKLMEELRNDYRYITQGYKDELQSAKQMYNRVSEAYIRYAEKPASNSGNTTTNVTIDK